MQGFTDLILGTIDLEIFINGLVLERAFDGANPQLIYLVLATLNSRKPTSGVVIHRINLKLFYYKNAPYHVFIDLYNAFESIKRVLLYDVPIIFGIQRNLH